MPIETHAVRLLLIASESPAVTSLAASLQASLGAEVEIASSFQAAQTALRNTTFHAILIEEATPPEHPEALEGIYEPAGNAAVLEVSFGLTNASRVVRQVRYALRQRAMMEGHHQIVARRLVQMELCGALAGLRLQTEVALRAPAPELSFHLEALARLTEAIALQVQIGGAAPPPASDLHQKQEVRRTSV